MVEFMKAVDTILQRGDCILIYPEQSMWWNYTKPKPLKIGAYKFAARNNVPIIPIFITMRDSDIVGDDGFPVQEYYINIEAPIYPTDGMAEKENAEEMKEKNADIVRPNLTGDGKYKSVTGFHINLGIDTAYVEGNCETGIILFRYAEGLLCYAEAAAELEGKWNDAVLNKTLKPLRERAGVTWVEPKADPNFPFTGLTPLLQEIRRERRSELALQGFRLDDLMRWAEAGTLKGMKGRGRGAYLGEDGILYQSYSPKDHETLKSVLVDNDKWMDPLQQYLPNGYLFNLNRDYLLPIPQDELQMNHQIHQNPGWETVSE